MNTEYYKEHLLDRATMLAMRAFLAVQPKTKFEPASRPDFDALMEKTTAADGVIYEAASLGGVAGWWCRPTNALAHCAVLYLHGGAYVLGNAAAYRNFCGQIAARAGAAVFDVEYGLAPEHPFPQALNDAEAVFGSLSESGFTKLAIAGDSAGGGLAFSLLQSVTAKAKQDHGQGAMAGVVISPWTDLALTGESLTTHADNDPLLTRDMLDEAARLYLGAHDRHDPRASPLYGDFTGFPPILFHVGEDEVLLDDSRRVAERIEAAGGSVQLNVWQGITHVFASNLMLQAAKEALDKVGDFLRQQFGNN